MNLTVCKHCGVVVDFNVCVSNYGFNLEWSRGSDSTTVTMCPVCKYELPENPDYSNTLLPFKKHKEGD